MSTEERVEPGFYKGRAIAGSEQYGTTKKGDEQIAIDVEIPSLGCSYTTFLYFTEAAAPYAIERLRACGWQGNDISKLAGIDKNEITVGIKYETYQGKERMKIDIATGGGRVQLENPLDERAKRAFAARMQSFLKGAGGGAPAPQQQRREPPARSMAQQNTDNDFGGFEPDGGDPGEIPFASTVDRAPKHLRTRRLWERF